MHRSRPPSLDDLRARFAPPAHGPLDATDTTDRAATPLVDDDEARGAHDRGPFGERLLDRQRRLWAELDAVDPRWPEVDRDPAAIRID